MNPSTSPPSSPLSSVGSRSPSLPADYPSPPSSRASDSGSQKRAAQESTPDSDSPPAKKQKHLQPKELKTEHLDLRALNESHDESFHATEILKLEKLLQILRNKRKIVVIAGAGISVSAGSMLSKSRSKSYDINYADAPYSTRFSLLQRVI